MGELDTEDLLLDLPAYPAWREALKQWPTSGYTWGDIVPHEWFYAAFGLKLVTDDMTVKEAQTIELKRLSMFEPFREALLTDHRMYLDSVPGIGYEIVTPAEQSRRAHSSAMRTISNEMRKYRQRLISVNIAALSDSERRENADLLARQASLAQAFKRRPLLTEDEE